MIPQNLQKHLHYAMIAGGFYLAYLVYKNGVSGVVADVVSGGLDVVGQVGAGVVVGVGEAVGIPATNQDQCSIDMANGDDWAASFSCPAPVFLKWQKDKLVSGLGNILN